MTNQSNPASRLHEILHATLGGDPNARMLEVWATVFGLPQSDDIEVTRHLIALSELLEEVKRLIEANPNINHQRYLAGFPSIRNAIGPINLHSTRQGVILNNITSEVLTRLEFCDEELRRYYAEEAIDPDELSAIAQATSALFDIVASTVQDATLRVILLEGLERVRIALALYRIHGAKGLKSSLQQLLGIVLTEQEAIKNEKSKNADVIARLGALLDKLDSFSAKALTIRKAITKPVRHLLSLIPKDKGTNEDEAANEDGDSTESESDVIES